MRFFYGIQNLRSLEVPITELRPITVLVGRNNSGKSSLLRTFPLLKQSVQDNVESPISWYGKLVDFGNYETAVKKNCENEGIKFNFEIENLINSSVALEADKIIAGENYFFKRSDIGKVSVSMLVKQVNQREIKRETQINLQKPKIQLRIISDENGDTELLEFNGKKILDQGSKFSYIFRRNYIFSIVSPNYLGDLQDLNYDKFGLRNLIAVQLGNLLYDEISNSDISIKEIESETLKILENIKIDSKTCSILEKNATSPVFREFYQKIRKDQSKIQSKLNEVCGVFWAIAMHNQVCDIFNSIVINSVYFGPKRGRDDRYFRSQKLEIMEVSSEGENLSEFYESLDDEVISEFSSWVQEFFGFGISIRKANGSTSVHIDEYGEEFNLADSGFGIAEVLPFLTQIWWELQESKSKLYTSDSTRTKPTFHYEGHLELPKLIAIEQPELHLHPAHQAKMADVLVNAIKSSENASISKPNFVIETHSQSLINRLGELVRHGEISENDINVLVFSKQFKDSRTEVEIQNSQYDSEGILRNWPYGFFRYSK